MSIGQNLLKIKSELPAGITLVAVSKTKSPEMILEAYENGQRDFGENYVQELVEKAEKLPKDIHWHFIGHLQSNKVKYIAPFVHLIHGVDSLKLLNEIDKQGKKINKKINCLLQVHIASEETKFGFDAAECSELVKGASTDNLANVNICGLMGMSSNTTDLNQVRMEFRSLKLLFDDLRKIKSSFSILSMGMSSDFKIAIDEGSTLIRIGSSIFGERDYTKN